MASRESERYIGGTGWYLVPTQMGSGPPGLCAARMYGQMKLGSARPSRGSSCLHFLKICVSESEIKLFQNGFSVPLKNII